MCGEKPFVFSDMKSGEGLEDIIAFVVHQGILGLSELPMIMDHSETEFSR
jgi:hypothetical protein